MIKTLALKQLTLDDARFVLRNTRANDHRTSIAAARQAQPNAASHRRLALRVHYEHPAGLTDFELAEITGVTQPSIGKRRLDLQRVDLIEETDETRPSPSGSAATVWKITEMGKHEYETMQSLQAGKGASH